MSSLVQVLYNLYPSAFILSSDPNQKLFQVVIMISCKLSIMHGMGDLSASAFACFAGVLLTAFQTRYVSLLPKCTWQIFQRMLRIWSLGSETTTGAPPCTFLSKDRKQRVCIRAMATRTTTGVHLHSSIFAFTDEIGALVGMPSHYSVSI